MRLLRIVLALLACACLVPSVSQAAFPGTNGRIAFAGQGVFSINPDGSGLAKVADGSQPAWSPDGARIAFAARSIGIVNADGTGERPLTTSTGNTFDFDPAWSPNGQQIAFVSQTGGTGELRVINADGAGARTLVSDAATKSSPTWSPDGSRIAFARTEFTGTAVVGGIYAVNADGSGLVQLTSNAGGFAFGGDNTPSWSPDGGRLVVSRTGQSGTGIDVVNADGSGRVSLTPGAGNTDRNPAWSPNGQQIVFDRSDPNGGSHLYVMNADGSGLHQITPQGRGFYGEPDWGSSTIAPKPLTLTVTGARSQRLDKRNRVHLFGTCNRACAVTASASARVGKKRVRNDTGTRKRASTQLTAGKKTKIYMKFLAKPARLIRRALARNKRVVLKVELKAVEAGVPTPVTVVRRIRIRYP